MAKGISIRVEEELLRAAHIRAARLGLTVQDYMHGLIERDLFPDRNRELTDAQKEQLRDAAYQLKAALDKVDDILTAALEPQAKESAAPDYDIGVSMQ